MDAYTGNINRIDAIHTRLESHTAVVVRDPHITDVDL